MRYADVLLMIAECTNEVNGGPTQEAVDAVNDVRRRAGATLVLKLILAGQKYFRGVCA